MHDPVALGDAAAARPIKTDGVHLVEIGHRGVTLGDELQNEKLADICAAQPDRFVGLASVALQHPDLAAAQLEDSVKAARTARRAHRRQHWVSWMRRSSFSCGLGPPIPEGMSGAPVVAIADGEFDVEGMQPAYRPPGRVYRFIGVYSGRLLKVRWRRNSESFGKLGQSKKSFRLRPEERAVS
jgi:hypothetical protein